MHCNWDLLILLLWAGSCAKLDVEVWSLILSTICRIFTWKLIWFMACFENWESGIYYSSVSNFTSGNFYRFLVQGIRPKQVLKIHNCKNEQYIDCWENGEADGGGAVQANGVCDRRGVDVCRRRLWHNPAALLHPCTVSPNYGRGRTRFLSGKQGWFFLNEGSWAWGLGWTWTSPAQVTEYYLPERQNGHVF